MITIYFVLILISVIITAIAVYNFIKIFKIEKNMNNYLFAITSQRGYYIGAVIFSFILMIAVIVQSVPYLSDIRIISIIFFFFSMFLLSLSHLIYHNSVIKKCDNTEEFFKEFEINLKNRCEKMLLKYIYSKEKDLEKVKEIFRINKHLCKDKK